MLDYLRSHRGNLLHVLDPFKVPIEQATDKARALSDLEFPALILASTDWENFEDTLNRYIERIRRASESLPILLHFPPRVGVGMPLVGAADGLLYPFLLESDDPYFVWRSYVDTKERLAQTASAWSLKPPEFIELAALTFGDDARSKSVMGIDPVETTAQHLGTLSWAIKTLGLDGAYLYSRYAKVPNETCAYFRNRLGPDQLLFASGGVRSAERARELFTAGADFVIFSGALECDNWRPVLESMVRGCRGEMQRAQHNPR